MRLSVARSPSLTAAIHVMVTMPKEVAKQTNKYSKQVIAPEWKEAVRAHAPAVKMFRTRLVEPSTVYVSSTGVRLVSGKGPWIRQTEFGGHREYLHPYTRKNRGGGGSHQVKRHTQRQFWHFRKTGYAVYPAAEEMIPRIAALWVQTIKRTIHEGIEEI